MKYLILILLFAGSAWAQSTDYICQVRQYQLDIDMTGDRSTHVWIHDRYNHEMIFHGYAGSIEQGNRVSTFFFYGNQEPVKLSFLNKDIQERPKQLKGHIDTILGGFLVVDYFNCKEK